MTIRTVVVAGLAATLWVIPSFGTQGMGTMQRDARHPDRFVLGHDRAAGGGHALLERADLVAGAAVVSDAHPID